MTGRELIMYILTNHLEDESVFKDGKFIGFITEAEAAVKLKTGVASIHVLCDMGTLLYFDFGKNRYISIVSIDKLIEEDKFWRDKDI